MDDRLVLRVRRLGETQDSSAATAIELQARAIPIRRPGLERQLIERTAARLEALRGVEVRPIR